MKKGENIFVMGDKVNNNRQNYERPLIARDAPQNERLLARH